MRASEPTVSNAVSLVSECAEGSPRIITSKSISNLLPISLPSGQSFRGGSRHALPTFAGALSESNWHLRPHRNDSRAARNPQRFLADELHGATKTGRVQLLTPDQLRSGLIEVAALDIVAADSRAERRRGRAARLR